MGIERFPEAKKDLRRAILHKDRGFAVRLTPNGSTRHVKVANLDSSIVINNVPIRVNTQNIISSITVDSGKNASVIGPITIDSGVNITVNGNFTVI